MTWPFLAYVIEVLFWANVLAVAVLITIIAVQKVQRRYVR